MASDPLLRYCHQMASPAAGFVEANRLLLPGMASDIRLGPVSNFVSEDCDRFVASFRSYRDPSVQARVLIFRFSSAPSPSTARTWHAIENECPHANAPLEHADIEDIGDTKVVVCPFHSYDFSLETGLGETHHLKACTFTVSERDDQLYMQNPGSASDDFRLLGVRPVSQKFPENVPLTPTTDARRDSVRSYCNLILFTPGPLEKVALVRELSALFKKGSLPVRTKGDADAEPPSVPPRLPSIQTVASSKVGRRGKAGNVQNRVKLLHALANIELWAIDLAIDVCTRFIDWRVGDVNGKSGKRLGNEFFGDFIRVAEDEAKHFSLLVQRLEQLGTTFGSLPVHNGLWESALTTRHSLFSRLAIVNLVHEARGLDVNPKQIEKCAAAGDHETAAVLDIIHTDEITHVAVGHRHFLHLCKAANLDPVETFRDQVKRYWNGAVKGPFNEQDRELAGMSRDWYADLKGEHDIRDDAAATPADS